MIELNINLVVEHDPDGRRRYKLYENGELVASSEDFHSRRDLVDDLAHLLHDRLEGK